MVGENQIYRGGSDFPTSTVPVYPILYLSYFVVAPTDSTKIRTMIDILDVEFLIMASMLHESPDKECLL